MNMMTAHHAHGGAGSKVRLVLTVAVVLAACIGCGYSSLVNDKVQSPSAADLSWCKGTTKAVLRQVSDGGKWTKEKSTTVTVSLNIVGEKLCGLSAPSIYVGWLTVHDAPTYADLDTSGETSAYLGCIEASLASSDGACVIDHSASGYDPGEISIGAEQQRDRVTATVDEYSGCYRPAASFGSSRAEFLDDDASACTTYSPAGAVSPFRICTPPKSGAPLTPDGHGLRCGVRTDLSTQMWATAIRGPRVVADALGRKSPIVAAALVMYCPGLIGSVDPGMYALWVYR